MKHGAKMAKFGAYLQMKESGKRSQVIPNKKKTQARKACRKKVSV